MAKRGRQPIVELWTSTPNDKGECMVLGKYEYGFVVGERRLNNQTKEFYPVLQDTSYYGKLLNALHNILHRTAGKDAKDLQAYLDTYKSHISTLVGELKKNLTSEK